MIKFAVSTTTTSWPITEIKIEGLDFKILEIDGYGIRAKRDIDGKEFPPDRGYFNISWQDLYKIMKEDNGLWFKAKIEKE